jgi:hypothetical protein
LRALSPHRTSGHHSFSSSFRPMEDSSASLVPRSARGPVFKELRHSSTQLDRSLPVQDLLWWNKPKNLLAGVPLHVPSPPPPDVPMYSDASV